MQENNTFVSGEILILPKTEMEKKLNKIVFEQEETIYFLNTLFFVFFVFILNSFLIQIYIYRYIDIDIDIDINLLSAASSVIIASTRLVFLLAPRPSLKRLRHLPSPSPHLTSASSNRFRG